MWAVLQNILINTTQGETWHPPGSCMTVTERRGLFQMSSVQLQCHLVPQPTHTHSLYWSHSCGTCFPGALRVMVPAGLLWAFSLQRVLLNRDLQDFRALPKLCCLSSYVNLSLTNSPHATNSSIISNSCSVRLCKAQTPRKRLNSSMLISWCFKKHLMRHQIWDDSTSRAPFTHRDMNTPVSFTPTNWMKLALFWKGI